MNRHLTLAVAALFVMAAACTAAEPHPLLGTWKNVAARQSDEGDWQVSGNDVTTLKHITGTHFAFMAFNSDTKEVVVAFGGRVAIERDKYVETVDYGPKSILGLIGGERQVFSWKIDGNILTQIGTLSNGMYVGERWKRVTTQEKTAK